MRQVVLVGKAWAGAKPLVQIKRSSRIREVYRPDLSIKAWRLPAACWLPGMAAVKWLKNPSLATVGEGRIMSFSIRSLSLYSRRRHFSPFMLKDPSTEWGLWGASTTGTVFLARYRSGYRRRLVKVIASVASRWLFHLSEEGWTNWH